MPPSITDGAFSPDGHAFVLRDYSAPISSRLFASEIWRIGPPDMAATPAPPAGGDPAGASPLRGPAAMLLVLVGSAALLVARTRRRRQAGADASQLR